jgi:hypothetical protein
MTKKNKTTTTTRQESESDTELVPLALEGEPWNVLTPVVQDAGADTIEFSFDVDVSDATWKKLEEERTLRRCCTKSGKPCMSRTGSTSKYRPQAHEAAIASS